SCTVLPLQSPLSLYIYTLSLHDALPILLPNVTHRLETNRIQTVSALVTGAFLLTACGSSPDTTVTTEYYRFADQPQDNDVPDAEDRKSTRLNSSHVSISYAVFCLKKKTT